MSEILKTILNETLNEVREEMGLVQVTIERHQDEIRERRKEVLTAEGQQKCAVYEDERAMRKIEELRVYLTRLGKQPYALMNKMKKLDDERGRTTGNRRVADTNVVKARDDLRSKETVLAVTEERHLELQKQWHEMSDLVLKYQD